MTAFRRIVGALGVLFVVGLAGFVLTVLGRGIGARRPPSRAEVLVARRLRHFAIPGGTCCLANPQPSTAESLRRAMEHFADHCASCHGNDGKGQTEIGRNLYPRAPDMTGSETQQLSDGELFFIIKNGVRFTGMPAWGSDSPEDDRASWQLVHFIRHLPQITSRELDEMSRMNPLPPSEMDERKEEEEFLEGGGEPPTAKPEPKHSHGKTNS